MPDLSSSIEACRHSPGVVPTHLGLLIMMCGGLSFPNLLRECGENNAEPLDAVILA